MSDRRHGPVIRLSQDDENTHRTPLETLLVGAERLASHRHAELMADVDKMVMASLRGLDKAAALTTTATPAQIMLEVEAAALSKAWRALCEKHDDAHSDQFGPEVTCK